MRGLLLSLVLVVAVGLTTNGSGSGGGGGGVWAFTIPCTTTQNGDQPGCGWYHSGSPTSLTPVDYGQWQPQSYPYQIFPTIYGLTSNLICPSGTYTSQRGQPFCRPCSPGMYQPYSYSSGCYGVGYGWVAPGTRATSQSQCPQGRFAVEGRYCVACGPGRFRQNSITCQDYYYWYGLRGAIPYATDDPRHPTYASNYPTSTSWADGSTAFGVQYYCPTGRYSADLSGPNYYRPTRCLTCPPGTYSTSTTGSQVCNSVTLLGTAYFTSTAPGINNPDPMGAPEGPAPNYLQTFPVGTQFSALGNGRGWYAQCPPGQYSSGFGGSCVQCNAGTISAMAMHPSSICTTCPDGYYAASGKAVCLPCPSGQISNVFVGRGACSQCAPGFFAPTVASSICTPCPTGYIAAGSGLSNCTACQAGSRPNPARDTCIQCSAGTYQPTAASGSCMPCPPGTWSDIGATLCTPCTTVATVVKCMDCPGGGVQGFVGQSVCAVCGPGESPGLQACCPRFRSCDPCPAGARATWDGSSGSCAPCDAGTYQSAISQTTCFACADGKYTNNVGQSLCVECPPAQYSDAASGRSACAYCAPGRYSPVPGTASCLNCQPGNYSLTGQSVCSQCTPGTYNPNYGSANCTRCGPGTFMPVSGAEICTNCTVGKFTTSFGTTNCTDCPIGRYGPGTGALDCVDCPLGRFNSVSGASVCTACSFNTYGPDTGLTACLACRQGQAGFNSTTPPVNNSTGPVTGKVACLSCPRGSYADVYGNGLCSKCPVGTYMNRTGAVTCDPCPIGRYINSTGSTFCQFCAAGRYQPQLGYHECWYCPEGTYSPGGSAYCAGCEYGKYSSVQGGACVDCSPGTYTDLTGATGCRNCTEAPVGSKPASVTCSVCQAGYRTLPSLLCEQCTPGRAQAVSGQTICDPCAPGTYTSVVQQATCQACAIGTASNQPALDTPCPDCPIGSYADSNGRTGCTFCAPGFISYIPRTFQCSPCTAGSFVSHSNATVCSDCGPGTYQPSQNGSTCLQCPLGTASSLSAVTECPACERGYFAQIEGSVNCLPCAPGQSSPPAAVSCFNCPPGKYSVSGNSPSCTDCPNGKYSDTPGATNCALCERGKFAALAGSPNCTDCNVGTYASQQQTLVCPPCPAGTFANETGQINCFPCAIGSYRSDNQSATTCYECPIAQYGVLAGQPSCVPCPAGTDTSVLGSTTCAFCAPGQYSNAETGGVCRNSTAGFYTNTDGLSYMIACPRGRFSDQIGATMCGACGAGKTSGNGDTKCTNCPRGTFSSSIGSSSCVYCAAGAYSDGVGAVACKSCPDGSVADNNLTNCLCRADFARTEDAEFLRSDFSFGCRQCPPGADCLVVGSVYNELGAQAGWWPALHGNNLNFVQCLNSACLGGSDKNPSALCKPGYSGNLCTVCIRGYGRTGFYDCDQCPAPAINQLRLAGFTALLLAVTIVITRVTLNSSRKASKSSILLKILLSNLQFNALALSFQFTWPASIQAVFNFFNYGSNVTGFISVDCFLGESVTLSPFYIKTALVLCLLPAIIVLPVFLGFLPYALFERCYYGSLPPERIRELRDTFISGITIVLFLLHPSVTSLALSMFSCIKLGTNSDDLFLLPDMSQQCYTSFHQKMILVLTVPLIGLFVLGVPLVAFLLLWKNRTKIEFDNNEFKERFGFLYNGYKINFWYWEFAVVLRKVLLVSVSVYFSENQNVQALMAVFLCACALTAHAAARPFNHTTLNMMEFLSLISSFFTFFFGQFLFINVSSDIQLMASVMVLFVNLGYVVLVIAVWAYWFSQKLERLKAKAAKKRAEKDAAKKVPWSESDWRFHLQSGTAGLEEKEMEHFMHPADVPVNGIVAPNPKVEPHRSARASVVSMQESTSPMALLSGGTVLPPPPAQQQI